MTKKTGKVPEGGWGYVVGIGMAVPLICVFGMMPSFGILFGDFLSKLGEETSAVTLISSCFFTSFSITGLFADGLFKKYSVRSVGLIGAIAYSIGSFLTIFVNSMIQLLITFGIIQGAGFGLVLQTSLTTFNDYFIERRVFLMNVMQMIVGLGTIIAPTVIRILLEEYEFQGCIAILAAVNFNSILCMLVMHPVEWHMKFETIIESEDGEIIPMNKIEDGLKSESTQVNVVQENVNDIIEMTKEKYISVNYTKKQLSYEGLQKKSSSLIERATECLDLGLMKDFIYANIMIGVNFSLNSDMIFLTIQPIYLLTIGFNQRNAADIVSIGALTDLISRICLVILSMFLTIKARYIFFAGTLIMIVVRIVFLFVYEFMAMAIVTGIIGFARPWIQITMPLVFMEHLSHDKFTSGYGLFMFAQGIFTLVVGPITGWIRDVTQSYLLAFIFLILFLILCACSWLAEFIFMYYVKNKVSV